MSLIELFDKVVGEAGGKPSAFQRFHDNEPNSPFAHEINPLLSCLMPDVEVVVLELGEIPWIAVQHLCKVMDVVMQRKSRKTDFAL
ncbi:hypothetical protein SDC9_116224 [bioreactor metagenome]|uniref:Uncharacterized protein n=1 Tax=bioreactor metagenome TaxID=1076179 RepID=A0A645BV11_9ZZZZ